MSEVSGVDLDHDQVAAYYTAAVDLVLRYRQHQASWLPPAGPLADVLTPAQDTDADPVNHAQINEGNGDLDVALKYLESLLHADNTIPPGRRLGHVPSGGDDVSAIGAMLAAVLNPFTAVRDEAPGLVAAVEDESIRWLADLFGLPDTAGGLLTSGASIGTLHAIIAARHTLPARQWNRAVVYVTDYTHHCVRKAARAAGIRHVHRLPTTSRLVLDTRAAARRIRWDQAQALLPLVLAVTGGSTDLGAVDDIAAAAALAHDRRRPLWLHVDAALGGGYMLTDRGRALLSGIEHADSLVMDAHKSWSMPYGLSVLLLREEARLLAAFGGQRGHYMAADVRTTAGRRPDIADLGLELTREARGLRLWLPLYVHRPDTLRAQLDERLDWAQDAYRDLSADPLLDTPWRPDLTVVAFRVRGLDHAGHDAFLAALRARGVELSGTRIDGRSAVRMCLTSHRTHLTDIQAVLATIHHTAREMTNSAETPTAADVLTDTAQPPGAAADAESGQRGFTHDTQETA